MKFKLLIKQIINNVYKYKVIGFASCLIVVEKVLLNLYIGELNIGYKYSLDVLLTLIVIIPTLFIIVKDKDKAEVEQEKAMFMALHDSLTGLPNRTLLQEEFKKIIRLNQSRKTNGAVMFLDLDRFKDVNDTLGHEVGDKLLHAVSKRLQNCIRENDIICRLGGDEFVMIFSNGEDRQFIEIIAQKILDVLKAPFSIDNCIINVTTSIGISLFPADGRKIDDLIKAADMAMYKSKLSGKNHYEFYTQDLSSQQVEAASDLTRSIEI